MRVHTNQVNPYPQLDAMHSAQKAAAKREAARTRKRLFEVAPEVAGENEFEGVGGENGEAGARQQGQERHAVETNQAQTHEEKSISDWA
jgi:hypothetical protein